MFAQAIELLGRQQLSTLIVFSEPDFLTASQNGSVVPTMDRGPEVQCCSTDQKRKPLHPKVRGGLKMWDVDYHHQIR